MLILTRTVCWVELQHMRHFFVPRKHQHSWRNSISKRELSKYLLIVVLFAVGTLFLATIRESSISISSYEVIPWDAAPINPGGYFDTTTGTYTAPMNGYYQWVYLREAVAWSLQGFCFCYIWTMSECEAIHSSGLIFLPLMFGVNCNAQGWTPENTPRVVLTSKQYNCCRFNLGITKMCADTISIFFQFVDESVSGSQQWKREAMDHSSSWWIICAWLGFRSMTLISALRRVQPSSTCTSLLGRL